MDEKMKMIEELTTKLLDMLKQDIATGDVKDPRLILMMHDSDDTRH